MAAANNEFYEIQYEVLPQHEHVPNKWGAIEYVIWHPDCYKVQIPGRNMQKLPKSKYETVLKLKWLLDGDFSSKIKEDIEVKVEVRKFDSETKFAIISDVNFDIVPETKELKIIFDPACVQENVDGNREAYIYALTKSSKEHTKKFYFKICITDANLDRYLGNVDVSYADDFITKCFKVIGKEKSKKANTSNTSATRISVGYFTSLMADKIYAKRADVDVLVAKDNKLDLSGADIAYHYPLNNPSDKFEEGEIVAIIDQKIHKITPEINLAGHTGSEEGGGGFISAVITRRHYVAARKPKDERIVTELVCFIGIVPVQAEGPIQENNALYISENNPCRAMAEQNILADVEKYFVGFSLESCSKKGNKMVECVVSINQMFAEQRLERRCQELEESNEVHYKNVTHKDETFRKGTKCCASLALVFLLLLAIFAWQSIVPGTAYRYWWCQLGSKSTMERIQFKYKPSGTIDNIGLINGIEFTFEKLMRKTNLDYSEYRNCRAKIIGLRYFLNHDACAFGYRRTSNIFASKFAGRPVALAVAPSCRGVFEYVIQDTWVKRKQYWADVTRQRNCTWNGVVDHYAVAEMCGSKVFEIKCSWKPPRNKLNRKKPKQKNKTLIS